MAASFWRSTMTSEQKQETDLKFNISNQGDLSLFSVGLLTGHNLTLAQPA
jgi:hypothetical protein